MKAIITQRMYSLSPCCCSVDQLCPTLSTPWIAACQISLSLFHSRETALLSRQGETGAVTSILPFGVFHWPYVPFRKRKIKGWKWACLHPGLMLSWSEPSTQASFSLGSTRFSTTGECSPPQHTHTHAHTHTTALTYLPLTSYVR